MGAQVADVVNRDALLVTRDIEWCAPCRICLLCAGLTCLGCVRRVMDGHRRLLCAGRVHRGTVVFGFEQANKYTVLDQDGNTVNCLRPR